MTSNTSTFQRTNMKIKHLLFVAALVLPGIAPAGELPADLSQQATYDGVIDSISKPKMIVVIDDKVYHLTEATRIEAPGGYAALPTALEKGLRVVCDFVVDDAQRRLLTRVRIHDESVTTGQ